MIHYRKQPVLFTTRLGTWMRWFGWSPRWKAHKAAKQVQGFVG